ncbi:hypothetical protein BDFB_009450 [Asbolus verrucosus]|uniref:Uncharacterized protein n=1 Tax=Asbolus verrucosus TaxID=1661398 RepID=A0A482VRC6_ASBVE|nr:hypothetical protein BDFB_009450 [Asbolus verrucosus]
MRIKSVQRPKLYGLNQPI